MYYIYGLFKNGYEYDRFNGLFYIGQTKNVLKRVKEHTKEVGRYNPIKDKIISKYGYYHKVIWTCDTLDEANDREIWAIAWLGKYCDGTGILSNIADGGVRPSSSSKFSKERRRDSKLSIPYKEILQHIDNFINLDISITSYCQQNNLKESVFDHWLSRYSDKELTRKNKYLSDDDRSKIKELFDNGYKPMEISRLLHIIPQTIEYYLNTKCLRIAKKNHTEEFKIHHVNLCRNSKISAKKYAKINNIADCMLYRWLKIY
jgi:hypothetical protein